MNNNSTKYRDYALCREMLETVNVIRHLPELPVPVKNILSKNKPVFITGEGSSRIVPAKSIIYRNMLSGSPIPIYTEGATQALDYSLNEMTVIALSNSGRTREVMRLLQKLRAGDHQSLIGITANGNTPLTQIVDGTVLLRCGKEDATAATKSVVEQSLVVAQIYEYITGEQKPDYENLASAFGETLALNIPDKILDRIARADTIYLAGKNDGVAEELALKTNEIARKRSGYLEGTYAIHGVEEVMEKNEVVILLDPFEGEQQKFYDVLVTGIGMEVIAIAAKPTIFETIIVPEMGRFQSYLHLAAGWNLLVEVGLRLSVNLDKPVRARKIGNELIIQ